MTTASEGQALVFRASRFHSNNTRVWLGSAGKGWEREGRGVLLTFCRNPFTSASNSAFTLPFPLHPLPFCL